MLHAMKRSVLVFAALFAAVVSACTHEEIQAPAAVEFREIVLSARSGDDETKSSRDAEGKFYWSPKDEISLFRGEGGNGGWVFTSTNTESAVSAKFMGKVPVEVLDNPTGGDFWAIYPFNEENSFDGRFLTTVVPSEQVAAEGTFADGQFISFGRCSADDLSMTFYHLCGGIKFHLERSDISKITLRGNYDEPLAGTVSVDFNSKAPEVNYVLDPRTEITIGSPDGGCFKPGVDYFIVTLPVKLEGGFTVTFYSSDDSVERVIDTPLTINRAKFQWSKRPLDYTGEWIYETCNIENQGVQRFVEDVDYSMDMDYTQSYVESFYRQFNASDRPLPVSFTWEGDASWIVVSTDEKFENVVVSQDVSGSSSLDVYNLIPGVKYYYKVSNQWGEDLKLACMIPEGPVRMIEGVTRNMRDLGGWSTGTEYTENGEVQTTIKYGKIYRGYNINDITEEGRRILLEDLGVTLELDLRGYEFQNNNNSLDLPQNVLNGQVQYVNLSPVMFMFDQRTRQAGITADLYRAALKIIIQELTNGGAVFFHCIGGADRTGTLAFLIEALMGVSESDMSKEYEMTTFYGSLRMRNINVNNYNSGRCPYPFVELIRYLKDNFGYGFPYDERIQEIVENWAMQGENALAYEEIETLRSLLTEKGAILEH